MLSVKLVFFNLWHYFNETGFRAGVVSSRFQWVVLVIKAIKGLHNLFPKDFTGFFFYFLFGQGGIVSIHCYMSLKHETFCELVLEIIKNSLKYT